MAHKTGMMGNQRDFGMKGGPGKGSKSRITDNEKFADNYDSINWGRTSKTHPFLENPDLQSVSRSGNRIVKKYK